MPGDRRKRRVFVKTYGCQMNVYDSDRMAESLVPHGYERVEAVDVADLVILNTCHIREKAAEKVYSDLGRLRDLRNDRVAQGGGPMLLAVAGCTAQAEGEAMLERAPFVDLVVGPQSYHKLPELLARRERDGRSQLDTDFPLISKFDELTRHVEAAPPSAFLSIQEGCDKFCTFCVVPYTRGAEESRPVAAILSEARMLVAAGARELVLLGQNVNAYHGLGPDGTEWDLARLLRLLAEQPDLHRLRYTTSHPRDMNDALIAVHGEIEQVMPFLHLPVQSGSDRVLKAMNRGYTADDFRRIVEKLRRARPDIALSSDFITGFPGETDEDFAQTMKLVEEVGFAQAYSFKYSGRPGTPATGMRGQLKDEIKSARLAMLQALLERQSAAFNAATVGRRTSVLLERPGRHEGQLIGRSPWLQAVHVADATALRIGDMAEVEITACHPHSLAAVLCDGTPSQSVAA